MHHREILIIIEIYFLGNSEVLLTMIFSNVLFYTCKIHLAGFTIRLAGFTI